VFFSFWLSHVPRSRFGAFWALVRSCLAPGGRVFLVDNRDPDPSGEIEDDYVVRAGPDLDVRRLHDGSEYQVVEIYYEPEELRSLLGDEGWTAELDATRWFIFGEAIIRSVEGDDGRGEGGTAQPGGADESPRAGRSVHHDHIEPGRREADPGPDRDVGGGGARR
jgi:hypothetical protein